MLETFNNYFGEIDMPGPIIQRAEQLCHLHARAILTPLQGVFVSDFFEPEGARRYTSLWIKNQRHLIEMKNFVVAQSVDFTNCTVIEYVEFTSSNLESFEQQPNPQAALQAVVRFTNQLEGHLTAARNNCRHLHEFVVNHLMPRQ